MLLLFVAVFILVFEHVLPLLIVRRNPEKALELLLPPFDFAARFLHPLTGTLVRLIVDSRRERENGAAGNGAEEGAGEAVNGSEPVEEQHLIEQEERALLQSIVDFGGTLVREVMTPRPDIVAIPVEATIGELRALFREQEYRASRSSRKTSTISKASCSSRIWLCSPNRTRAASPLPGWCVRRCSCPRPSGCPSC